MAFAEVYNALQLKVVDGQENPISVPVSAKFFEVQTYASLTNHIADGWVLAINPAKYDALTDEQKAAIAEAAVETEAWKVENDAAAAEAAIAEIEKNGVAVNDADAGAAGRLRRGFRRSSSRSSPTWSETRPSSTARWPPSASSDREARPANGRAPPNGRILPWTARSRLSTGWSGR